ncbi:hypothetical protein JKP88DRAFT_276695 [Tribonema minus]|uniref:Uncharacterized protein n=1 Tax=Tribonema minus TaxID=303371 RepID=A0A835Z5A1_9STRA|nr:hypothetical protein JKP88DRAFT_276695 [Tribonema minus]
MSNFPLTDVEDSDSIAAMVSSMASCAVDAFLQSEFRDCRRFAVLAATLDACSALGVARLRAILASEGSSVTLSQQPASKAFLAHLRLCGSDPAGVRRALQMHIGDACTCLGPAPPGTGDEAEALAPGSRYIMLKEAAALRFSANDLAGALRGYGEALRVMRGMGSSMTEITPQQRDACALEVSKVRANMSLIELRRGNADAALERAASASARAARRGAAHAALRRHAEANTAYAAAADLAPTPRDAAECRRLEAAQLQLARDAEASQDSCAQLQQQQLQAPPGQHGAARGAAAAGSAGVRAAGAAAAAAKLTSVGHVLRALEAATHDAAMALAEYLHPVDLAHLERTCRFFGARPLLRRMRIRRAVQCRGVRSLCQCAAPAATPAAAAALAAAAAGVDAAVRAYCAAATDADACAALAALAAALAALVDAQSLAAEPREVRWGLIRVVHVDTPHAERCAFWRACAAEAALQEAQSFIGAFIGDVLAVKFLLREPTAALGALTRSMHDITDEVSIMQHAFVSACEAGTLGTRSQAVFESFLQRLVRHDVMSDVATALRRVLEPRAAAAAEFIDTALHMLHMLFNMCGQPCFRNTATGAAVTRHVHAFATLHAALPPRLPAARAPSAISAQQSTEIAAQLPAPATLGAVRAHFAWGADAAEVRAALEADPRLLRVWRETLQPMGAWLAQNRWGYLAALKVLAALNTARDARSDGVTANDRTLAAYLLVRGEEWGGGRARSVEGLSELFAGYYAMVRNYSYVLPQLDAWTQLLRRQHH